MNKFIRLTVILLPIVFLNACASIGIDTSTKKSGYNNTINSVKTVYLPYSFKDKSKPNGIIPANEAFSYVNFPQFGPLVVAAANQTLPSRENNPSHALLIGVHHTEASMSVRFIYTVTLIDISTKETVWRMETGIAAGGPLLGTLDEAKATSLIAGIKSKLIADKLLAAN